MTLQHPKGTGGCWDRGRQGSDTEGVTATGKSFPHCWCHQKHERWLCGWHLSWGRGVDADAERGWQKGTVSFQKILPEKVGRKLSSSSSSLPASVCTPKPGPAASEPRWPGPGTGTKFDVEWSDLWGKCWLEPASSLLCPCFYFWNHPQITVSGHLPAAYPTTITHSSSSQLNPFPLT